MWEAITSTITKLTLAVLGSNTEENCLLRTFSIQSRLKQLKDLARKGINETDKSLQNFSPTSVNLA